MCIESFGQKDKIESPLTAQDSTFRVTEHAAGSKFGSYCTKSKGLEDPISPIAFDPRVFKYGGASAVLNVQTPFSWFRVKTAAFETSVVSKGLFPLPAGPKYA